MEWVLDPAADHIWDSAGAIITDAGTEELAPTTDAGWELVRNSAAIVAQSGNLLMLPGIALGENDWRIFHYLGICNEKRGRRYKAVEYYSKAVARAENYRPYYRLGILYLEMNEADKALAVLRKVVQFNPDFLSGRFYLSMAAFFNNRIDILTGLPAIPANAKRS